MVAKRILSIFILILACQLVLKAQELEQAEDSIRPVVQFSGIITEGDSLYGVSGAFIYIPSTGRGTNTNLMGYFNMPANRGDSIVIAALGYQRQYLVIPEDTSGEYSYSVVLKLQQDTLELPEVVINSFPSEKVFKEVFLAMDLPYEQEYANLKKNLNSDVLAALLETQDLDGETSYNYFIRQQAAIAQRQHTVQTNPLLNPFAWAKFFKDINDYKKKKEEEKKKKNSDSDY